MPDLTIKNGQDKRDLSEIDGTTSGQSLINPGGSALKADLLSYLFLVLLPPVFFWRETLGWLTLGDQDAVFWFFPAYKFFAEQLTAGRLPLWTPYLYSGTPLFAQWQAGMLDPLNWIYLFGVTSRTLTLSLELSFALSLVATFIYTRNLGFKRRAGMVSAVIYSLSGFAVGRTLYPGFLHIVALAPLVLYFIDRLSRDGRLRDLVGGALVVAWQIVAAHPQPLVYSSLLASAYALFRAVERHGGSANTLKFRLRFLARFALMFMAGAGLAAIQLIPAWEIAGQSVRRQWPYQLFTLHSLHPVSLLTTLFPFFHGAGAKIYQLPYWGVYWHHNEAQIYLGFLAVTLAVAGAFYAARRHDRLGIFWSLVATAGTVLALGKYAGPIARLLYHFPLVSHFRSPNRHWMEVALACAVLAGYAVDKLLGEASTDLAGYLRKTVIALLVIGYLVGSFVLWRKDLAEQIIRSLPDLGQLPEGFLQAAGAEFYLPMIVMACAGATLLIFIHSRRRRQWYPVLLVLLIADFNLYAAFAPINNPFKLETLVGTAMPASLAADQSEREPIRYQIMLNPQTGEFNPFWFYGHEMATGYDPMLNERYKTFSGMDEAGRTYLATLLESQDRTLDLLNVRYVFVPPDILEQPAAGLAKNALPPLPPLPPLPSLPQIELAGGESAAYAGDGGASGDTLTIISALTNSAEIADRSVVAQVKASCETGGQWTSSLLAGRDTSEWAYDREDVRRLIKHSRATVADSWVVDSAAGFQAHAYAAHFKLPAGLSTCSGAKSVMIETKVDHRASLSIKRVLWEDSTSKRKTELARVPTSGLSDTRRWRPLPVHSEARPYRQFRLYENLRALPRAWLVKHARIAFEGDQLKLIQGIPIDSPGITFDPRFTALVDHATASRLHPDLLSKTGADQGEAGKVVKADILRREPAHLSIETERPERSLLVCSEVDLPGWQVKVDGVEAELLRLDYNLRGVQLEAGKHLVEMSYRPASIKIGAAVSFITALCLLLLVVREKRNRQD